jgi:hypothetical protein
MKLSASQTMDPAFWHAARVLVAVRQWALPLLHNMRA